MWRDKDGVVHTVANPDPFGTLPEALLESLRETLLTAEDDDGSALERLSAIQSLLQDWMDEFFESLPDQVDLELEAEYAEDDCGPDEDDDDDDEDEPQVALAVSTVAAMRDYIDSTPQRERLEAIEDVLSVVGVWEDLYIDHEKAAGHMLLQHGENGAQLRELTHDEVLQRHAALHEHEGPRHSSSS